MYELRKFLIPDVSKVSNQKRKKVEKLVKKIIYEKKDSLDIDPNLQKDLDIAVLDCMDLKDKYTVLYEETRYLEEKRIGKKW